MKKFFFIVLLMSFTLPALAARPSYKKAQKYYEKKEYEKAKEIYLELLIKHPDDRDALYYLGESYLQLDELDLAMDAFTKSIEINDEDYEAYIGIGKVYYLKEDYEKALAIFQMVAQEKPKNFEAYFYMGQIHLRKEEWMDAKEMFLKALKLDEDDSDARVGLASSYFQQERYEKCEKQLILALRLNPENSGAYFVLGKLYQKQDDHLKAKVSFYIAARLDQESLEPEMALVGEFIREGKLKKAYRLLEKIYPEDKSGDAYEKMIELRPEIYPTIGTKQLYSKETEKDLVSHEYTTQIIDRSHSVWLKYPTEKKVALYTELNYLPTKQKNLVSDVNNYNIVAYLYTLSLRALIAETLELKVTSNNRWGENKGSNVFPFKKAKIWEPGFMLRLLASPSFNVWASVFKDSFVARNFTTIQSFFVRRKTGLLGLEYRILPSLTAIGLEIEGAFYRGFLNNKRKQATYWVRFQFPKLIPTVTVELRGRYGSFSIVDPDYFSYRQRWQQFVIFSWLYKWKNQAEVQAVYRFLWNRMKNFSNVSESITANVTPPQTLSKNIFIGNYYELSFKKIFDPHVQLEVGGKFYQDTNDYKTISAFGVLKFVF